MFFEIYKQQNENNHQHRPIICVTVAADTKYLCACGVYVSDQKLLGYDEFLVNLQKNESRRRENDL